MPRAMLWPCSCPRAVGHLEEGQTEPFLNLSLLPGLEGLCWHGQGRGSVPRRAGFIAQLGDIPTFVSSQANPAPIIVNTDSLEQGLSVSLPVSFCFL